MREKQKNNNIWYKGKRNKEVEIKKVLKEKVGIDVESKGVWKIKLICTEKSYSA